MSVTPELLEQAKLRLLQMHYESRVGHIGGNLSCLEILMTLYHGVMGEADRFVLSKGHAAGALYTVLWSLGRLTDADLRQFHQDGTRIPGHPPVRGIPEVEFATGSLGHGLSLSAGLALANKLKGEAGRVFCLTSDGEWNEGSTWEALIFAVHNQLDNLTILVDQNGLQGLGRTEEIALRALPVKFRAFGAEVVEIDGHDCSAIAGALERSVGLTTVVARTCKGNGVSFMQDRFEWHYLPMSAEQYDQAVQEVKGQCVKHSAAG